MKYLIFKFILPVLIIFLFISNLNAVPLSPFIISVSPGINTIHAGGSENIVISFTQDMNPATINNAGIKIYGFESGVLSSVAVYNAGSKTAIIDPGKNFKTGEQIYVSLNSNVKTASNVSIDPFSYSFTADAPRGDGNFSSSVVSPDVINTGELISGDYDGDGAVDLISFNRDDHTASFIKNNGSGVFSLNNTFIIDPVEIKSFSSADYDNDGDLDLAFVIGVYFDFNIQIYINDGNGTFTAGYRGAIYNYGRVGTGQMKSYDIDNDGDIDLLPMSKDRFAGGISFLLNNGNAVFSAGGSLNQYICYEYPLGGWINSFEIADVNNDGNADAILESFQVGYDPICQCGAECFKIEVAVNNGHGNFTELITYSFPESHSIIFKGDFNNDRYIDFICSGVLLKNNGNGYFTSSPLPVYSGGVTGDFESDGDLDIMTREGNSVNIYKNNGDATFSSPVSFVTETGAGGITSGNFDNDCDLDIVFGNNINNDITVMKNSGETDYCALTGPELTLVNTENNLYTTSYINGYWEILNNPPCNASINGNNEDDSVFVNAGNSPGEFILYHHSIDDCGWKSCSKAVNVDNPMPVEITAFVSAVNGNNVTLNWTTDSEMNNSGFDVERSLFNNQLSVFNDQWNTLGFVTGNGTSSSPINYEFPDKNLSSGKYKYRLKQIDFNGNFEYYNLPDEVVIGVPEKFELSQNYPNPFNPSTVISYSLSENSFVTLKVYDVIGNEVATLVNENQNSGIYNYQFSTVNYKLSSGVYFYKIEAGSFTAVKRMLLIK